MLKLSLFHTPTLLVVDGFNLAYRAYNVWPLHLTDPEGRPCNMVVGIVQMLHAATQRIHGGVKVVTVWDSGASWRHREYAEYKAGRPGRPPEFDLQLPQVREALKRLSVPLVSTPGYEADDIIAGMAEHATEHRAMVVLSNDKDLLQVVRPHVRLMWPPKQKHEGHRFLDEQGVIDVIGVQPARVPDYKALVGDDSDNLPGVTGIGPVTARRLIGAHGDLEGVIAAAQAGNVPGKAGAALVAQAEQARQTYRLARLQGPPGRQIIRTLEEIDIAYIPWGMIDKERLTASLRPLGLERQAATICGA